MSKLQIYLHGELLSELTLEPGKEYVAGRGAQSHILLANERGISRQHLLIFQDENQTWMVKLTAKYGAIVFDNESVDQMELKSGVRFSIPPYEFLFTDHVEQHNHNQPNPRPLVDGSESSLKLESTTDSKSNNRISKTSLDNPPQEGNLDATAAGTSNLIAYLKVYNNKTKTEEVLKLEGHVWMAGRHPSCDIVINDVAFSRKHFDITRTSAGFFVTDHGSSNGTSLNGEQIEPQTPQKVVSADVITVKHIEFIFEIHDGEYKNRIGDLPNDLEVSKSAFIDVPDSNIHSRHDPLENRPENPLMLTDSFGGNVDNPVLRVPPQSKLKRKFEPKPIHYVIGGLLIVLVIGLVVDPSSDTKKGEATQTSETLTSELSPAIKREVDDIFNLAHNYYMQRKFVLCLSQVEKLHSLVPFHLNSKELETLCRQAQELEQIELDRKRKEDQQVAVENQIRSTVEKCAKLVNQKTTTGELQSCLQSAIELDPQNSQIVELQNQVAMNEALSKDKLLQAQQARERKSQGEHIYRRAVYLLNAGKLKSAAKEFKRFLDGNYPDLSKNESDARRSIASIDQKIELKINGLLQACLASVEQANLKQGISACQDVLKEDPSNSRAKENLDKAMSQLKREMKNLYDDAALEESLGNIEAAKEKWLKIRGSSVPNEDYYKKANIKLGKYGIGG